MTNVFLLYIITLILFLYIRKIYYLELLAVLFSCDRDELLNITLTNFFCHMKYYEPNVIFNFYFIDSGTSNRKYYVKYYNIKNYFYMNPTNPEFTYNMFWSYLYGDFVLFLEDDRPFIRNIERKIIYSNFIEESILVLKQNEYVKGITFKKDVSLNVTTMNIKTYLGYHLLCIIQKPIWQYYYSNGPSVYNTKFLLKTGDFISENIMALKFMRLKWYTGFTYKGIKCKSQNILSTKCQGISIHLGVGYSTKRQKNICKNYLY